MNTWLLIVLVIVVVAVLAGLFVLIRRRQRSGRILATSGPGTSKETDQ